MYGTFVIETLMRIFGSKSELVFQNGETIKENYNRNVVQVEIEYVVNKQNGRETDLVTLRTFTNLKKISINRKACLE